MLEPGQQQHLAPGLYQHLHHHQRQYPAPQALVEHPLHLLPGLQARARPSSASRVRCSSNSLRRRSSWLNARNSSSRSVKMPTSSAKSLIKRWTTRSTRKCRLSRRPSPLHSQPIAAPAISLSSRRAGWLARLNSPLSSSATFNNGICNRAINARSWPAGCHRPEYRRTAGQPG